MSKKKINSRLDELFTDLAQSSLPVDNPSANPQDRLASLPTDRIGEVAPHIVAPSIIDETIPPVRPVPAQPTDKRADKLPSTPTPKSAEIQTSEQLLGLLDLPQQTDWSFEERQLIDQVANQLFLTLENAHLFEQTQSALAQTEARAHELAVLNDMSRAFSANLEIEAVVKNIHHFTSQLMNTDNFFVALYHQDVEQISFPLVYSDAVIVDENHPEKPEWPSPQPVNGLVAHIIYTKEPLLIVEDVINYLRDHGIAFIEVGGGGASCLLAVPMLIGMQVTGVICVQSETKTHLYDEHHSSLLTTIGNQSAIAIENARLLTETRNLFKQTQAALDETETLYRASAGLNTAQAYQDILDVVCQNTILNTANINATIDIFDQPWEENNPPEIITVLAQRKKNQVSALGSRYRLHSIESIARLLRPGEPLVIEDMQHDERLDKRLHQRMAEKVHAQSAIFIPLVVTGSWIGYINSLFSDKITKSDQEIRRLMVISRQAATVIQNIRLLEETRRRANQLQTAAEIARDTSGTLALGELLLRTVNQVRDRFGYYHASVFLLDESGEWAVVRESTGQAGEEMKRIGHKLAVGSRSIVGSVTQQGEPFVVNDVSQESTHHPNPLLPQTRAEIGIPLKVSGKIIGALDVQSTEINAFTPDDISVLQILADQIGVAVENARAFEISEQAMEEMRRADQLKSQFLANMSHELRTPLNSIIGFSRVILKGIDGPVSDLQRQDLNAIYNSGQHLLTLINDILDLSKIEAGKMEIVIEDDVNVVELVQSVIPTVNGLVRDRSIIVKSELPPDLPPVRADPMKVRQVLINLLSNASKFTEQGSITVRAVQQTGPEGQAEVVISVDDTGPGISLEDQAKLFQRFSQIDASPTRKTGGSGLGLSISRHLIEMQGGRMWLTSEVGKGSSFSFSIPASLSQNNPLEPLPVDDTSSSQHIILAIDAEQQILNLYRRYLQPHQYQIVTQTDPRQVLMQVKTLHPYAICLDVAIQTNHSPKYNGWKLLEDLKGDPQTGHIPIIVCTIEDEHDKAMKLGAASYLLKPILEDDLVSALAQLGDGKQPD